MDEDEDKQDTSIKGRLLTLVNKIKSQSNKAEKPTEKEQAAPCEEAAIFTILLNSLQMNEFKPFIMKTKIQF